MQIKIHSIQKGASSYASELAEYAKMASRYASLSESTIFSQKIAKAQSTGSQSALEAYDEVFLPLLSKGFNIALDERGELLDSLEFAKLIKDKSEINFFIGGAYGLSARLKSSCDSVVSLSRMTMAHKIAKLVLFEQIYRALSINSSHPYHK